jgi:hypothetical protein
MPTHAPLGTKCTETDNGLTFTSPNNIQFQPPDGANGLLVIAFHKPYQNLFSKKNRHNLRVSLKRSLYSY